MGWSVYIHTYLPRGCAKLNQVGRPGLAYGHTVAGQRRTFTGFAMELSMPTHPGVGATRSNIFDLVQFYLNNPVTDVREKITICQEITQNREISVTTFVYAQIINCKFVRKTPLTRTDVRAIMLAQIFYLFCILCNPAS